MWSGEGSLYFSLFILVFSPFAFDILFLGGGIGHGFRRPPFCTSRCWLIVYRRRILSQSGSLLASFLAYGEGREASCLVYCSCALHLYSPFDAAAILRCAFLSLVTECLIQNSNLDMKARDLVKFCFLLDMLIVQIGVTLPVRDLSTPPSRI